MDGNTALNGNLLSVWSSWYKLDYPKDRLKFIFAVPDGSPQKDFIRSNFRRRMEVLTCQLRFTGAPQDRFLEIGGIRDALLQRARSSDFGWFLDSDVMPPRDSIRNFLQDCADIVGGVVRVPDNRGRFRLGFGYFRPFYDFCDTIPSDFFMVDSVNTACMFISREVMNDPRVTFKLWAIPMPDGKKLDISEDHGYCHSAGEAGYTVWVDARVKCVHLRMWNGRIVRLEV
jgi:hypothetical protein